VPRRDPDRLSVEQAFGRVLWSLRAEQGLSQEALGHATGSGRTYISELERGHKGPSLNMVFRLAATLEISPSEFVQRVEQMQRRSTT
jgi:transcriptional regulator with XRE-family HTH domain